MLSDPDVMDATRQVLTTVAAATKSWRFRSGNHAMATAGMARAADLLGEALLLAERPPARGANVLVRSAFECWLVGGWALFGGSDALLGIEKERVRNETSLAEGVSLAPDVMDHLTRQKGDLENLTKEVLGSGAPSSVKFEQIARALPPLIKNQTAEHEDVDVLTIYNVLYRSHSTNDAHPWKVVGQYVRESGQGLRVESFGPWQNPVMSAAVMAMYLGVLGRWIEQARGGDGNRWNEAVGRLRDLLQPGPPPLA